MTSGAGAGGGRPADEQVMGDVAGAIKFLRAQPHANGKVGVIGFCSAGAFPISRRQRARHRRHRGLLGGSVS